MGKRLGSKTDMSMTALEREMSAKQKAAIHGVKTFSLYQAARHLREATMALGVAGDTDTARELRLIVRRLDRKRLAWMRREPK